MIVVVGYRLTLTRMMVRIVGDDGVGSGDGQWMVRRSQWWCSVSEERGRPVVKSYRFKQGEVERKIGRRRLSGRGVMEKN